MDEDNVTPLGQPVTEAPLESGQIDYFGFEEENIVHLPDGKSWIQHKTLNEGERRKYQNALNRDVRIDKAKGDMHLRIASGDEKKELLKTAITGWNLVRDGKPVPFDDKNVRAFLDKAPPKIIDLIEKDIRKKNSWLQSDMTVEDIQQEIDNLEELKQQKIEEEEKA